MSWRKRCTTWEIPAMAGEALRLSALGALVGGTVVPPGGEGGEDDPLVSSIVHDSRNAGSGSLFVAIPGFSTDGHDHAVAAIRSGTVAVAVERLLPVEVAQLLLHSSRAALGPMAAALAGHPSERLQVAGVTGTNGKTTVTYLLESIATAAGRRSGIVGTTGAWIMGRLVQLERTTPEADDLQRLFVEMIDAGVEVAAVEVSSHALSLGRVEGTRFEVVAFTNLSQDHLDFHGDMDAYFEAKSRLFEPGRARRAVIWTDDPAGARLAAATPRPVVEVGAATGQVRAAGVVCSWEGIDFTLVTPAGSTNIALPLRGRFNLANALVAAAIALELDIGLDAVAAGLRDAPVIPGRFERVHSGQPFEVVVDYAHTPASIGEAVAAARALTVGSVVVVFGAGGDRDRGKRPLMGQAASAADRVVLTSDNPRSEDPAAIIAEVLAGVGNPGWAVEPDRRLAIRHAIATAGPGDAILILGKGHERGQDLAGVVRPFDDLEVAAEELAALGYPRREGSFGRPAGVGR
jgi:UDP-N-acetylmuramoyl-L-alanyl-D-glutamate--2,6-diaminopimelate ligase